MQEKQALRNDISLLEMQLTQVKAKEYDKVDMIKKQADMETRVAYYLAEKDLNQKDKIRLEKDLVALTREK